MPTSSSNSITRFLSASPRRPAWIASVSATWLPIVKTGFKDVIGSWKITEMSLPRRRLMAAIGSCVSSRPSKRIAPDTSALSGNRRNTAIAVTLLPLPDSPTTATVRLTGISKLTPLTA